MPVAIIHPVRLALVAVLMAGCALPARADSPPFSIGAVYGYGDNVDVYGVQGVWAPRMGNDFLGQPGLEWRVSSQLGRWIARNNPVVHDSLTYGNVLSEVRYSPWRTNSKIFSRCRKKAHIVWQYGTWLACIDPFAAASVRTRSSGL